MNSLLLAARTSLVMAGLTASLLFASWALGLLPDQDALVWQGRETLCRATAIHFSAAAQRGDVDWIRATARELVGQSPDLLGISIRRTSGELMVESGVPDPTGIPIEMPIAGSGSDWGTLQLRFRPTASWPDWLPDWLRDRRLVLVGLVSVGAGLLGFLELLLALRQLGWGRADRSPERVRSTLDTLAEGVVLLDGRGKIALSNKAFADMIGLPVTHVEGRAALDLVWTDPGSKAARPDRLPWTRAIEEGTPQLGTVLHLGYDGKPVRKVSVNSMPIVGDDGARRGALATFDDLTALERCIEDRTHELRGANERLQKEISENERLQQEISEISVREQRRIGHDLHDGLGQHLTGISFMIKVLQQRLEGRSLEEAAQAAQLGDLVTAAISQTRALARGLQPVELDANGLESALEELAASTQRACGVTCDFEHGGDVLIEDNEAATQLYRIAQESVNNAVKHSRAKHIRIALCSDNGRVTLTVRDDGIGLPSDASARNGMGLRIMEYRARLIGARFHVQQEEGGGTAVTSILEAAGSV